MNLSPDTPPAASVETLKRPAPQSSFSVDEKTAAADFQHLLDTPHCDVKTKLAAEEILDTTTEASAWLALNVAEFVPNIEPVNTAEATAHISVSSVEPSNHAFTEIDSVMTANALLGSPVSIQPQTERLATAAETENTFVSSLSNTAEMLASTAMPVALNPSSPALFLATEAVAATPSLPTPNVYHTDFEQGIATHLSWLADHVIGQARIQMNPPHLGALEVQLQLRENQLHAAFFSSNSEVCQRLQESLPVLQQLLDEHGVHLAHADVKQQSPHSDTDRPSANTTELSVVQKDATVEEANPAKTPLYQQSTLLDTWA